MGDWDNMEADGISAGVSHWNGWFYCGVDPLLLLKESHLPLMACGANLQRAPASGLGSCNMLYIQ